MITMELENNEQKAYEKAKKRVENEKGFYTHLVVYILMNIAILFFKTKILGFVPNENQDEGFFTWWMFSNIITPVAWGIGLFFHWLWAFEKTFAFSKKWEEKKIRKLMEEEE